jgi:hypothetical protein
LTSCAADGRTDRTYARGAAAQQRKRGITEWQRKRGDDGDSKRR